MCLLKINFLANYYFCQYEMYGSNFLVKNHETI